MRGVTKPLAIVAASALIVVGLLAGSARQAASADIKNLMGDNFQNIQVILFNLVSSKYEKLPGQIETIHKHAVELTKRLPDTVKSDAQKRMFTTYAYQLESSTSNMLTVLEALNQHDKTAQEPGKLNIDYLRVVVAGQFGQVVTSCVLCHNQFRRYKLK